ncbi:MAG: DUF4143 domain-containing protein, partial [Deltaproteobacteria bacterium]|nr:DUF4143 domain-containing protein [Deltaproteobacteria bacterium]
RVSGLPQTTLKRYMALLEGVFLLHFLPAWSTNLSKRVTRSPKLHLVDSGLAGHLLGYVPQGQPLPGPLLETFAFNEIHRLRATSAVRPTAYHFRTHAGIEVDILLEDRLGRLVAIEIKAASTIGARDLRGLRFLSENLKERFKAGIVLYSGRDVLPLGPRLYAVPLSMLWNV